MVFVFIFSSKKNQLQFGKKMKKFLKNFSITLFVQKNQSQKNSDVIFHLKRRIHKPRKINETMNPLFGLGHEI